MGNTTLTVGIGGSAAAALVRALAGALREKYDIAIVADADAKEATARLMQRSPGLELILVEARGDGFATLRDFCDLTIWVADGNAAAMASADLAVDHMILETPEGLQQVIDFIETDGLLDEATPDG